MRVRELAVAGAFEFVPPIFRDARGQVVTPFHGEGFSRVGGHRAFPVAQTIHSVSRRGVVRGVHFTVTPPGRTAKYVFCPHGRVLDIVVDLRLGSPTFGRYDAVPLGPDDCRAVYLPVGVGHAFVALRDGSVMSYLLSECFTPENERELSVFDPRLRLPIPSDIEPILSERDRKAPTLEQVMAAGELPEYADCLRIEADIFGAYGNAAV